MKKILSLTACIMFLGVMHAQAQLQLPEIFSDHMVLQRQQSVPVWGTGARPGHKIRVCFKKYTAQTTADSHGAWKTTLPAMEAGGPYKLKVIGSQDTLVYHDVMVGEVWIASGQSNMAWPLNQSVHFDSLQHDLDRPNIRLFKMEKAVHVSSKPYTKKEINAVSSGSFYQSASWKRSGAKTAPGFSAVAWYFAQSLQDSLKVPVGIIQNAIGGSPTQAWISRATLAHHSELKKYVPGGDEDWFSVDKLHPFISSRVKENLGKALESEQVNTYEHPFAPAYLYEHGVAPLIPFGMRGVIWYQGESNANYPNEHKKLFKALIKNWRQAWNRGNFPFLYVQLPAISNRNRWPEFREGQKELLNLPNTGMAVTIDLGDPNNPTNVHPPVKQPVGQRLSRIALAKVYGFNIAVTGPRVDNYQLSNQQLLITFDHARQLAVSDGKGLKGLTLQGYEQNGSREQIIEDFDVKLKADSLIISIPKGFSVTKVKYGWAPYPDVNLVNEGGLPAGPFKIELPGNF